MNTKQEWKIGDCLELLPEIKDESIDMILTDLPYGTIKNSWDIIIPLDKLWYQYKRIIKNNGVIALTSNEPFTSKLIISNLKGFKYRLDWNKCIPSGVGYAKYRPMQQTEDICIFTGNGEKTKYNPQMIKRDKPIKSGGNKLKKDTCSTIAGIDQSKEYKKTYEYKNPTTLLKFMKVRRNSIHPTQKPVALFEYLIKTYTNEGDTVHDSCLGSGTTLEACMNTNRNCICFEISNEWEEHYKRRLKTNNLKLDDF